MSEVDIKKVLAACNGHLLSFAKLLNKNYETPEHIKRLSRALMEVEAGVTKRLIVTIPPRHGKSYLCSQIFPAWFMGRNPDKYIITAGYNQEFATGFGRKVRDITKTDEFKAVFPNVSIKDDDAAANRFSTNKDGQYFSVGVGSSTTGRGAHLFLIDDPVKDRVEADSKTYRDRLVDWYSAVAYTRLMPGGAIVVIMTRWHEEDLVGHLLQQKHEDWKVINMPALVGVNPLWPERYDYSAMMRIKETLSEYDWLSLYQQNPTPRDGIIFKSSNMRKGVDEEYEGYVMAVDPAISLKESADETAVTVIGIRNKIPLHLDELETIHGHWSFNDQINMIKMMFNKWDGMDGKRVSMIGVEAVAYQKALGQELWRHELPAHEVRLDGDKVRKAMSISHLFEQGRIRINTPSLREQMLRFRGKDEKNDRVDAMILAVRMALDYHMEGREEKVNPYEGLNAHERRLKRVLEEQRKELTGTHEVFDLSDTSMYDVDSEFY